MIRLLAYWLAANAAVVSVMTLAGYGVFGVRPRNVEEWHRTPPIYFWRKKWRRYIVKHPISGLSIEYATDLELAVRHIEERFGERPRRASTMPDYWTFTMGSPR